MEGKSVKCHPHSVKAAPPKKVDWLKPNAYPVIMGNPAKGE